MMSHCQCILCKSNDVSSVETIRVNDLTSLYQRLFQINVASEFSDIKEVFFLHCQNCDLYFFYPLVEATEKLYVSLQKFDWYYPKEKDEYEVALRFINQNDRVLEIGCGEGYFAGKGKFNSYTGLEFNKAAVEKAQSNGLKVLGASIESFCLNNEEQYDAVCAFQVMEHVANLEEFIACCRKCLRDKGLLIYSVPNVDSFVSLGTNNALNMPPHHMTWWTEKCLRNLPQYFHLELVSLEKDVLQEAHQRYYLSVLIYRSLKKDKKNSAVLIDLSLYSKFLWMISWRLSALMMKGIKDPRMAPRGQSITAVYRKIR